MSDYIKIIFTLILSLIYFGNTFPIVRQNPFIRHYGREGQFVSSRINCIEQDSKGFIWIGSNVGLTRFDGFHFKSFPMPIQTDGAFASQPHSLAVDGEDRIWIATMVGLFVFDTGLNEFRHLNEELPDLPHAPRSLVVDSGGREVIVDDGHYCFRVSLNPLRCDTIRDKDKEYAYQKLYPGHSFADTINWGISGGNLSVSKMDREGGIWLGTYYDGLYYYSPKLQLFSSIKTAYGDTPDIVRSISQRSDGRIYVGTEDKGLFMLYYDNERLCPVDANGGTVQDLPDDIHSLMFDNETLWIGTWFDGIYLFDTGNNKIIRRYYSGKPDCGLKNNSIVSLFKSKEGSIIIGTYEGLYYYDRKQDDMIPVEGAESCFVHSMTQTTDGSVWVGSLNHPLLKLQFDALSDKWICREITDFRHNCITSLISDTLDNIYIGTDNAGVWHFNAKEKDSYDFKKIIDGREIGSSVNQMIIDKEGLLWLGTFNGLFRYNDRQVVHFTKNHGLETNFFNYASGYLDESGNIYVGTYDGLIKFNPEDFPAVEKKLTPYITNISVGDKDVAVDGLLELDYNSPSISIDYSVPVYSDPYTVYYRYILEGSGKDWESIGDNSQSIFISHMAPGKYHLRIQASYDTQFKSGETADLDIIVKPPFWESGTAYILYSILLISLFLMAISVFKHYRNNKALKMQIDKLLKNQNLLINTSESSPYAMAKEIISNSEK